jgi:hypothetical protein
MRAVNSNTVEVYKDFMNSHPRNKRAKDAKRGIEELNWQREDPLSLANALRTLLTDPSSTVRRKHATMGINKGRNLWKRYYALYGYDITGLLRGSEVPAVLWFKYPINAEYDEYLPDRWRLTRLELGDRSVRISGAQVGTVVSIPFILCADISLAAAGVLNVRFSDVVEAGVPHSDILSSSVDSFPNRKNALRDLPPVEPMELPQGYDD